MLPRWGVFAILSLNVNSITDQITINIDKIKEDVKQKYSKVIECSITNNKVTE